MIHLDTSFLVRALVGGSREEAHLREWLDKSVPLRISSVAWTEFLCGPVEENHIGLAIRVFRDPIPFAGEDGVQAAKLFNLTGRRRGSMVDCMIAAVALRGSAGVATSNPEDFRRFSVAGLKVLAP